MFNLTMLFLSLWISLAPSIIFFLCFFGLSSRYFSPLIYRPWSLSMASDFPPHGDKGKKEESEGRNNDIPVIYVNSGWTEWPRTTLHIGYSHDSQFSAVFDEYPAADRCSRRKSPPFRNFIISGSPLSLMPDISSGSRGGAQNFCQFQDIFIYPTW